MTAILGIAHAGHVWLAGDRSVSAGSSVIPCATPKVWRRDGAVFGCSGGAEFQQIMQHADLPPPPLPDDDVTDRLRWLVREYVPALRRALADAGRVGKDKDGYDTVDGWALIGMRGRLYELHGSSMAVIPCAERVAGVGCGAELAIGAACGLLTLPPLSDREQVCRGIEDVVMEALSVASRFNAYVRGPFDVVTTGEPGVAHA